MLIRNWTVEVKPWVYQFYESLTYLCHNQRGEAWKVYSFRREPKQNGAKVKLKHGIGAVGESCQQMVWLFLQCRVAAYSTSRDGPIRHVAECHQECFAAGGKVVAVVEGADSADLVFQATLQVKLYYSFLSRLADTISSCFMP